MNDSELKVAIAFARLELLELGDGRRALTQCPGILEVAKAIRAAQSDARIAALRDQATAK